MKLLYLFLFPSLLFATGPVVVTFDAQGNPSAASTSTVASWLSSTPTYATIYVADGAAAQNVSTGSSYAKLTHFTTNGPASNCTPDSANDKITITETGTYIIGATTSFLSDTNNVVWQCVAFVNGVKKDECHWERKISTGADVGSAAMVGIINVPSVPVDIDLRVRHDNVGTVSITVSFMNLCIVRIGP